MKRLGAVREVDGPGTDSPRSGQRCRSPAGGLIAGAGLTVKTHIGRIFTKLGLRDRAAAIVFAYEHRIIAPS
jgi:hypothetical protein